VGLRWNVATVATIDTGGVDEKLAAILRGGTVRYGKTAYPRRSALKLLWITLATAGLLVAQFALDSTHPWYILLAVVTPVLEGIAESYTVAVGVVITREGARFSTRLRSLACSWYDVDVRETGNAGVIQWWEAGRMRKVRIGGLPKRENLECVRVLEACITHFGVPANRPVRGFWTWPAWARFGAGWVPALLAAFVVVLVRHLG
jgi:hypothetical protein